MNIVKYCHNDAKTSFSSEMLCKYVYFVPIYRSARGFRYILSSNGTSENQGYFVILCTVSGMFGDNVCLHTVDESSQSKASEISKTEYKTRLK